MEPRPAARIRRPPSLSAPSELGLGLGALFLAEGSSPRVPSFLLPLAEAEGGSSPLASGGGSPAGSPLFYHAPAVPGASRELSPRAAFVGGGLLGRGAGYLLPHSLSLGRMEHAGAPPTPLALRVPVGAAAPAAAKSAADEGGAHDECCSGPSCCEAAHVWAMRFAVHIVLLSIFETLFFWQFVGPSEDKALLDLINSYVGGTLRACPQWNASERFVVEAFMALLLNRTAIRGASVAAAAKRAHFNSNLLRNSWLYVAGLAILFLLLSAFSVRRKGGPLSLPWKMIFLENLALITMLGLYELMFFSSVVMPYQVRSPLPRMVPLPPPTPLPHPASTSHAASPQPLLSPPGRVRPGARRARRGRNRPRLLPQRHVGQLTSFA